MPQTLGLLTRFRLALPRLRFCFVDDPRHALRSGRFGLISLAVLPGAKPFAALLLISGARYQQAQSGTRSKGNREGAERVSLDSAGSLPSAVL